MLSRMKSFLSWFVILAHVITTSIFIPSASAWAEQSKSPPPGLVQGSLSLNHAQLIQIDLDQPLPVDGVHVVLDLPVQLKVQVQQNNLWREVPSLSSIELAPGEHLLTMPITSTAALRLQLTPRGETFRLHPFVGVMADESFYQGVQSVVAGKKVGDNSDLNSGSETIETWSLADRKGRRSFGFLLPWTPDQIDQAVLHYTLTGVADASGVVRQVNDELAQGGVAIAPSQAPVFVAEPLSASWLRSGLNQIHLSSADSSIQIEPVNVWLEVILRDENAGIAGLRSNFGLPSESLQSLIDGDIGTSISTQSAADNAFLPVGWNTVWGKNVTLTSSAPTLDAYLKKPTRVESVAVITRAGVSDIHLDAWVDGAWQTGVASAKISAELQTEKLNFHSLDLPVPVVAAALRLRFDSLTQTSVQVAQVNISGSAAGDSFATLVIDSMARGNLYGEQVYIRGHVGDVEEDLLPARVRAGVTAFSSTLGGGFEGWAHGSSARQGMLRVSATLKDGQSVWRDVALSGHPDNSYALLQGNLASQLASHGDDALNATGNDDAETAIDVRQVAGELTVDNITEIKFDEATLRMDNGAMLFKSNIKISKLEDRDLAALSAGMVNVTKGPRKGYRFLPHGVRFNKPVKVSLPFDRAMLPEGYTAEDINTYYFDEQSGRWLTLARDQVDDTADQIVSSTDHFTDMINAVIQVPDSPETTAFNPTSIQGMQLANPAAGIDLIGAPVANSSGDARFNYPIAVPPGRQGMAPGLALQYNSSSTNGWLGLGWALSMPAISIDTRWGVPRYDGDFETETYTLNGEQLAPVAHRAALVERVSDERRFYPRIEGGFSRILRNGDSPKEYTWEVTGKSGTKYFYGGEDSTLNTEAVLRTKDGNIGHWALVASQDTYGNRIEYRYTRVADTGILPPDDGSVPGEPGEQLYLSEIEYTKHANNSSQTFVVSFKRDIDLGEDRRPDVQIDARLGLKRVTSHLLREIHVHYGADKVRHYELGYKTGPFAKTLLESIAHFGEDDSEFYRHELEYFDEVVDGQHFGMDKTILLGSGLPTPGVIPGQAESILSIDDGLTALGGSQSRGSGGSVAITAGVQDGNAGCKSGTAGVHGGSSSSTTHGRISLTDITGDGLPDLLLGEDGLRYLENTYSITNPDTASIVFDEARSIEGAPQDFLVSESKTNSSGVQATIGICNAAVFAGQNKSRSKSTTDTYLSDVNGDGLIDVVAGGVVQFNNGPQGSDPVQFVATSAPTPNAIVNGQPVTTGLIDTDAEQLELAEDRLSFPLQDAVRVWRAPRNGVVSISSPIQLLSAATADAQSDGVDVSIEHATASDPTVLLWQAVIEASESTEIDPVNTPNGFDPFSLQNLTVVAGDHLYFRLRSGRDELIGDQWQIADGLNDTVEWNPTVTYVGDSEVLDGNGLSTVSYKASEGFALSGQPLAMPLTGTVSVSGTLTKGETGDLLSYGLYRNPGVDPLMPFGEFLTGGDLAAGAAASVEVATSINVTAGDVLQFRIDAASNVQWSSVNWQPKLHYTATPDHPDLVLFDDEGTPTQQLMAAATSSVYGEAVIEREQWIANQTGILSIEPLASVSANGAWFVAKRNGAVVAGPLQLTAGTAAAPLSLDVSLGDVIRFEYHASQTAGLNLPQVRLTGAANLTVSANFYRTEEPALLGPMYRHWGQFVYNSTANNGLIDRQKLVETTIDAAQFNTGLTNLEDASTAEELQSGFDALPDIGIADFSAMSAVGATWQGADPFTQVQATQMQSSRFGSQRLTTQVSVASSTTGQTVAIAKLSKTTTDGWSVGAGVNAVGIGGSANKNNADSVSVDLIDYLDMNGDRYPDIVGSGQIQYTNALGALQPTPTLFTGIEQTEPSKSTVSSSGIGAGGSFAENLNDAGSFSESDPGSSGRLQGKIFHATRSSPGAGLSLGEVDANDQSEWFWRDINGDSLPDRMYSNGEVQLNLGQRFGAPEQWGQPFLKEGKSTNKDAGLGINIGAMSIALGISANSSDTSQTMALQDVNGDGLLDQVIRSGSVLQVALNSGSGFRPVQIWDNASSGFADSSLAGSGINGAFTACLPFPSPVKACVNPSAWTSKNLSREHVALQDIDGDGYVDALTSNNIDNLSVRRSTIGRTNLLKDIKRPLGAKITLAYARAGNTYDLPHNRWVLSQVSVHDGVSETGSASTSQDLQRYRISYEDGYHDRRERQFYGFARTVVEQLDSNGTVYRRQLTDYHNRDYYRHGLVKATQLQDGSGNLWLSSTNTWEVRDVLANNPLADLQNDAAIGFPQLTQSVSNQHEGQPSALLSHQMTYQYDGYGNVSQASDFGDSGTGDDWNAQVQYHEDISDWIVGIPDRVTIKSSGGAVLRDRQSVINSQGKPSGISVNAGGSTLTTQLTYDGYGNLQSLTRPPNNAGESLAFIYGYDGQVHTYINSISDSYGLSASSLTNSYYGIALSQTDANGHSILTELDNRGRLIAVRAPYEAGSNTITHQYYSDVVPAWSLTQHADEGRSNTIDTSTVIDGLGRSLVTRRDQSIDASSDGSASEQVQSSGEIHFDALGRVVSQFYPRVNGGHSKSVGRADTEANRTSFTFDVLDRTIETKLPDGAILSNNYGFGQDNGQQRLLTRHTDALLQPTDTYRDVRGRISAVRQINPDGGALWTRYQYSPIDELKQVTDANLNITSVLYDLAGRRTQIDNPDTGETQWQYDNASNVIAKITANLQASGQSINYRYDHERLIGIDYPQYAANDVSYEYGASGGSNNTAGRISQVTDASGVEQYQYGALGEVTKRIRQINNITGRPDATYETSYRYDSWNRLRELTYPDGEVLTHQYDAGGQLESLNGDKSGNSYAYLEKRTYDVHGQRAYQRFGNGTEMSYEYDGERRWIANSTAKNTSRTFIDNAYQLDVMGNITSVVNSGQANGNDFGGPSSQSYQYDNLYRLTNAQGLWTSSKGKQERYSLTMNYDGIHNIEQKTQSHESKPGNQWKEEKKTSYDWDYSYDHNQPHAASQIGERLYSYDANGNGTGWTSTQNGTSRTQIWDEENRLHELKDNGQPHRYVYDASGDRIIKRGPGGETHYVFPHFVIKNGSQGSKHIFAGSERITSKLMRQGSQTLINAQLDVSTATSTTTAGNGNSGNGNNGNSNNGNGNGNGNNGNGNSGNGNGNNGNGNSGNNGNNGNNGNGGGTANGQYESDQYYYHGDHLGSSNYITDDSGEVYEHLEYFAYGETWVHQHTNTNKRIAYNFTGKELDESTGLYYYGARYYDPRTSVWISPDPILGNYLNGSPNGGVMNPANLGLYSHTYNNPINFVDPDGLAPDWWNKLVVDSRIEDRSDAEKEYIRANNINAWKVGTYRKGSNNISSTATRFSFRGGSPAGKSILTSGDGSEGNAARHATWQAIITAEIGEKAAKAMGNAHEDNIQLDLSIRKANSSDQADMIADQLNNQIGIKIGNRMKGESRKSIFKAILEEFRANGMWMTNGRNVYRKSLSQEKFDSLNTALPSMDKNGHWVKGAAERLNPK